MKNQDFKATIWVDQTPEEAFNAINNPRGWWSEEIEGITDKLNAEWSYHYEDVHLCRMKIIELIPGQKVAWLVTDNYFNFTADKKEWIGTKVIFEISKKNKQTQIDFTHLGLVPDYECYEICHDAWTGYIKNSLYDLISTGEGKPNKGSGITSHQKHNHPKDQNFSVTLRIDQSPEEVFRVICNVRGWWSGFYSEEIKGNTERPDDEFTFRAGGGAHYSKQKLVEVIPNKRIVWLITDSELAFLKKKDEWTGTKVIFEIAKKADKTELVFTHEGLVPEIECYGACSNAWSLYVQEKLLPLITTGKGMIGQAGIMQ